MPALVVALSGVIAMSAPTAHAGPAASETSSPSSISASAATQASRELAAGCGTAGRGLRPGTSVRTATIAGVPRTYRVSVPAGYTGRQAVPLILAFHGHAERATSLARYTGLSALPAIVVYPEGLRGPDGLLSFQGAPYSSPRADDVAFTAAILRDMRSSGCVDRARTYAVGRSNGGGFAGMLACRMPGTFAAVGVVDPALYARAPNRCAGAPATSVIAFHGTADRVIRYGGGSRQGQRYLPVRSWLDSWARTNGCVPVPITLPVNRVVDRVGWLPCRELSEVTHYRIRGGGHVWPGAAGRRGGVSDSISATALMWQFFQRHPLSAGSS